MSSRPNSSSEPETVVVSMSATKELMEELDDVISMRGYHSRSQALRDAITDFLRKYSIQAEAGSMGMVAILVKVVDHVAFDQGLSKILHGDSTLAVMSISRSIEDDVHIRTVLVNGELGRISELIGQIRAVRGAAGMEFTILPL